MSRIARRVQRLTKAHLPLKCCFPLQNYKIQNMIPKALLPKKDGKVYPNTVDNANLLKGDHKDQYVLSERALRTMNYDTKIIKIS